MDTAKKNSAEKKRSIRVLSSRELEQVRGGMVMHIRDRRDKKAGKRALKRALRKAT